VGKTETARCRAETEQLLDGPVSHVAPRTVRPLSHGSPKAGHPFLKYAVFCSQHSLPPIPKIRHPPLETSCTKPRANSSSKS
jgi:hypothetical protein